MLEKNIRGIESEQQALISVYQDKWKAIARSTNRINREKVAKGVKSAYVVLGQEEPKIHFFDSPNAALNASQEQLWEELGGQLRTTDWSCILEELINLIMDEIVVLIDLLWNHLWADLWNQFWSQLSSELREQLGLMQGATYREEPPYRECIEVENWACYGSYFDFCISVLGCNPDIKNWGIFQSLASESYWLYPYQGVCLVCDRPTKISFDGEDHIHAENEPAIQFADGFSVYVHHGKYVHHEVITLS